MKKELSSKVPVSMDRDVHTKIRTLQKELELASISATIRYLFRVRDEKK